MGGEFDSKVGWLVDRARRICKVISEVLSLWPPLKKSKTRLPPQVRAKAVRLRGRKHSWICSGGLWRCEVCLQISHSEVVASRGNQRCPGKQCGLQTATLSEKGHQVVYITCEGVPLYLCIKCGAWASKKAVGLSEVCVGTPSRAGAQAIRRISVHRKHPRLELSVDLDGVPGQVAGPCTGSVAPILTAAERLEAIRNRVRARQAAHEPA